MCVLSGETTIKVEKNQNRVPFEWVFEVGSARAPGERFLKKNKIEKKACLLSLVEPRQVDVG